MMGLIGPSAACFLATTILEYPKYSPITLQRQSNGTILLQTYGSPGQSFDFQASTNLQTWLDLGAAMADANGFVQFTDTNAPSFPYRFYLTLPQ